MSTHPILVTGSTGGLGKKIALGLARQGVPTIVSGRRPEAVEAVRQQAASLGSPSTGLVADLSSLADVRRAASELSETPVGGVVANAGITTAREQVSADGYELTFAVNVLAHHLLLHLLSAALAPGARIVMIASGVHDPDNMLARRMGVPEPRWTSIQQMAHPQPMQPGDERRAGGERYSTSKLANILQARAFQTHLSINERPIDCFAYDPGLMVDTDLAREVPGILRALFRGIGTLATPFVSNMRLSGNSARNVVRLLTDPGIAGSGFAYYDGANRRDPSPDALRVDLMEEMWDGLSALLGAPEEYAESASELPRPRLQ